MGWIDSLFPDRCVGCGVRGAVVCGPCLARARRAPPAPPPPGLDACWAPFAYDGVVASAVVALKYANRRAALSGLVAAMAVGCPADADAVTWVPTLPSRRRRRGFDQASLLARSLGRRLAVPALPLLERGPGGAQTSLNGPARRTGPAFTVRALRGGPPPTVLLVDDVCTTGATLRNAAAALRGEGCERVIGVTVARTLLKTTERDSEKPSEDKHRPTPDLLPLERTTMQHPTSARTPAPNRPGAGALAGPRLSADRHVRVRQIGDQVRAGTYHPPVEGVVESLVVALLPHIRR